MPDNKKKNQETETDLNQTPGDQDTDRDQDLETPSGESTPGSGREFEFSNPNLQGKSPQEIEAIVNLYENTIQSQSSRLNEVTAESKRGSREFEEPDPPSYSRDDFFEDPVPILTDIVQREMKRTVAPINREIENMRTQGTVNSAWQKARAKFSDFDEYKPAIEAMLSAQGTPPEEVTAQMLEGLYYGAVGYFIRQGVTPSGQPVNRAGSGGGETPSGEAPPPNIPPQHRPSGAPLPRQKKEGRTVRDLTEEERQVARMWNMTPEEYLNQQEDHVMELGAVENG